MDSSADWSYVKVKSRKHSRILCYGDSLTAGFYAGGTRFSPYATALKEALANLGFACTLTVCGLSGRLAAEMVDEAHVPKTRPDICGEVGKGIARTLDDADDPFDLAILMAGTNDLGSFIDVSTTQQAVCKLHDICHSRGVPTVVLAAPCTFKESQKKFRRSLGEWSNQAEHVLAFADPEKMIPRSVPAYWEKDHIHFSPAGSRALGFALAPVIAEVLQDLGHRKLTEQHVSLPAESPVAAPAAAPVAVPYVPHHGLQTPRQNQSLNGARQLQRPSKYTSSAAHQPMSAREARWSTMKARMSAEGFPPHPSGRGSETNGTLQSARAGAGAEDWTNRAP
jgi:lysophospholipase L1-like esterase